MKIKDMKYEFQNLICFPRKIMSWSIKWQSLKLSSASLISWELDLARPCRQINGCFRECCCQPIACLLSVSVNRDNTTTDRPAIVIAIVAGILFEMICCWRLFFTFTCWSVFDCWLLRQWRYCGLKSFDGIAFHVFLAHLLWAVACSCNKAWAIYKNNSNDYYSVHGDKICMFECFALFIWCSCCCCCCN